jgi:hypothetical protein
VCQDEVIEGDHLKEPSMVESSATIGVDIAKSVFQVHGIDASWEVAVRRRQLRRTEVVNFLAENLPRKSPFASQDHHHHRFEPRQERAYQ